MITVNQQDIEEMMNHLPHHLQNIFEAIVRELIGELSGIRVLKQFVDQFEKDNPVDCAITNTCASLISFIMNELQEKAQNNSIQAVDVASIVRNGLLHEAKKITTKMQEKKDSKNGN